EFGFEHDLANVRRAVHDMRIGYPVPVDKRLRGLGRLRQPILARPVLADPQGRIRHHHYGEGEYQQSELVIHQLLADSGTTSHDHELVSVDAGGAEAPADWAILQSPETYTGYEGTANFA